MVTEVNADNFDEEVLQSDVPVLVDFFHHECPPCKTLAPVLDAFNEQANSSVKIVKLNVRENEGFTDKFNFRYVPNFALFKDGALVKQEHMYPMVQEGITVSKISDWVKSGLSI